MSFSLTVRGAGRRGAREPNHDDRVGTYLVCRYLSQRLLVRLLHRLGSSLLRMAPVSK